MPFRCLSVKTAQIFKLNQGERCSQWPLALNLLAFAFRPLANLKKKHTEAVGDGQQIMYGMFMQCNDKYDIYLFDDA